MAKYNHFQVIATAERTERVPKVNGAWYFGLPFVMDTDNVTWADYFGSIEPRAFLVGVRPSGHGQVGQVYPLDVAAIQAGIDAAAAIDAAAEGDKPALQVQIDAGLAEQANFLGFSIEGTDYENDVNMTVALAGGIKEAYLQQDNAAEAYTLDPALTDAVLAALPVKRYKGHIFWNNVQ